MSQSSVPTVLSITERTYMRARTTTTENPQKKPLMARIDGAFVVVSRGVFVEEVSPANLKIAGMVRLQ
jgi:hypothetical protein